MRILVSLGTPWDLFYIILFLKKEKKKHGRTLISYQVLSRSLFSHASDMNINMFKFFKYMNGSHFFEVQVVEWSGFSDFSVQIYTKITSSYSPHHPRRES